MSKQHLTTGSSAAKIPATTHENAEETIVFLTPTLSAYVLELIAYDLAHGLAAIITDLEEEATTLAAFLHDNLPTDLRTPVPALAERGR